MTIQPCSRHELEDDVARMRAAISDIGPPPFQDRIDQQLQGSTMRYGLLTRLAARATTREAPSEELNRRVVGVQLIYEGLSLTRTFARVSSWNDDPESDSDIELLVAEVLVSRGFSLLARTEAVPEAVEAVRALGRDETNRRLGQHTPDRSDHALEADVFELSLVAGITATGAHRLRGTRSFAMRLTESLDENYEDDTHRFKHSVLEELAEVVSESD